jgi:signal transduction histidine kinase
VDRLELPHVEPPPESLDRLRHEVEELRASRERLVQGADADRRRIERDLHDGPQQHLVALVVNLQRARQSVDDDPEAAKALLEEMGRDVQQALEETARLAHRIYPPLLEAGGLTAALRAAAVSAGVRAHLDVAPSTSYPPEVAGAVYFCCLEILESAGDAAQVAITVRDEEGAVVFRVVAEGVGLQQAPGAALSGLRDRIEALGGELSIQAEPDSAIYVAGSLPLAR